MVGYSVCLDSTLCCVCFFIQNVLQKKEIEQKQTDCSRTSLPSEMSFSGIKKKKKLASKLVKLLLLYSTVTCCLVTVEHVLSFWTSCSVKKFYLAHRANPRICGCYLLSMLPAFFIIIIASAPSAITVQQQPFLKNKMFLKIEQSARQKRDINKSRSIWLCLFPESLLKQFHTYVTEQALSDNIIQYCIIYMS